MEKKGTLKKQIIGTVILGLCVRLLLSFVGRPCVIPTGSMAPTVNAGDVTIVSSWPYIIGEPQRGDVIVFKGEDYQLLKRIIGMPNDTISFSNGKVVINGEGLEEAYIPDGVITFSPQTFVVPEGHYFVLGDNRHNSRDSRFFEQPYIESSRIIAKVNYVIPVSEYTDVFCAEEYKKNPEKSVLSSVATALMNRHEP